MKLTESIKLATMGFKPADIKRFGESEISTDEIIKLAESGYTVKEVNELITLTKEQNSVVQPETTVPTHEPESAPAPEGDHAAIDYKEQFETKSKELEEMKKQISGLQAELIHKDLSGGAQVPTPRQQFQEALKGLY